MKLYVGLGNPGDKYEHTRHNVGFMLVDKLASKYSCSWERSGKLESLVAKPAAVNLMFAKPQTFMNASGKAVSALLNYYNIAKEELVVVHDDLDIKLGEYKIQNGKGPKLHNGVESVEKSLGYTDFKRIRIGVDNREAGNRINGEDYVLQKFSADELEIIERTLEKLVIEILQ
jgi:PTH1 family peptidyl-tRNA hydrolase